MPIILWQQWTRRMFCSSMRFIPMVAALAITEKTYVTPTMMYRHEKPCLGLGVGSASPNLSP